MKIKKVNQLKEIIFNLILIQMNIIEKIIKKKKKMKMKVIIIMNTVQLVIIFLIKEKLKIKVIIQDIID